MKIENASQKEPSNCSNSWRVQGDKMGTTITPYVPASYYVAPIQTNVLMINVDVYRNGTSVLSGWVWCFRNDVGPWHTVVCTDVERQVQTEVSHQSNVHSKPQHPNGLLIRWGDLNLFRTFTTTLDAVWTVDIKIHPSK